MNENTSEYGPDVLCDEAMLITITHRPAGSGDAWFCYICGNTEHETA